MNRLTIIDSHPLAYRAYYSPGTRNLKTSNGILSGLFFGFIRSYLTLQHRFPNSHFIFCFDSGASWRNKVYPAYKFHHTVGTLKDFDTQLQDVAIFIRALGIPTFIQSGLEADDLISICASMWCSCKIQHTAVIVSSDRDFFQLVSDKISCYDDREKLFYGPLEVEGKTGVKPEHIVNYKALLGDPADSIKGILGYGFKKAAQYAIYEELEDFLTLEESMTVRLNRQLITLPRTIEDITDLISRQAVRKLTININKAFSAFFGRRLTLVDPYEVARLLELYEVKTIHLSDFGD